MRVGQPHPGERSDGREAAAVIATGLRSRGNWRVLLGVTSGSQAWWLGGVLGAAAVLTLLFALLPPYEIDMRYFKMWTRVLVLDGLHNAYSGTYPATYSIYPPFTLAAFWAVGQFYRLVADPSFGLEAALASPLLSYLLKLPGITFHLLTGFALFRVAVGIRGFGVALTTAVVYLFHPAALLDLTYWGQPDSLYAFFLVLAVVGVATGELALGWGALAVAALAKPQAWSLAPLLVAAGLARHPYRAWVRGLLAGAAVIAIVLAPFVLGGRLSQLATLPGQMGEVAPRVSANAHNLWWLVYGGEAAFRSLDTTILLASPVLVTPRRIGYGLWGCASLLALAMLLRSKEEAAIYEAAAFVAFAFVMVATRIHENHMFMVLPLGALAAVYRPALWGIGVGLSAVFFVNLIMHDPGLAFRLGNLLDSSWQRTITVGNAAGATLLLSAWTLRLLAQVWSPAPGPATPELPPP